MTLGARQKKAHIFEQDRLDYYIEPHWCSERLFQYELFTGNVVDPSCGSGRIIDAALSYGFEAFGNDIVARGHWAQASVCDFFDYKAEVDNVVSNPPFKRADEYWPQALKLAKRKVALLLQFAWLAGNGRSIELQRSPMRRVWILTPRPSMPPAEVIERGEKPGGGIEDFCWVVWEHGYVGKPEIMWLRR